MKMIKRFLCCFILFFVFPMSTEAKWKFVAPMPNARYGHDAVLGSDGRIYVMGGFVWHRHDGAYSNIVYDPAKNNWTVLEPVPGFVKRGEMGSDRDICTLALFNAIIKI